MLTPLIDQLARARRHELLDASARRRLGHHRVSAKLRPRRRLASPLVLIDGPRRLISVLLRRSAGLATRVAARIEPQPMAPPRM
jgi:hypothetical protein